MPHSVQQIRLNAPSGAGRKALRRILQHVAGAVADEYRKSAISKRAGVKIGDGSLWTDLADSIRVRVLSDTEATVTVDHKAAMQKQYGGLQTPGSSIRGVLSGAKFIPVGINDARETRASEYPNKDLVFVPTGGFRERRKKIEESEMRKRGGSDRFSPLFAWRERRKLRRYSNRRAGKISAQNKPAGVLIDPKAPRNIRAKYLLFSSIYVPESQADKWFPDKGSVRQRAVNALSEVQ